jgi:hypothetical protein
MRKHSTPVFLAAVVAAVSILSANAQAAACKSLEQKACSEAASCTWVSSYERSDGRTVKAYCRNAPRKSGDMNSAASAAPKASQ